MKTKPAIMNNNNMVKILFLLLLSISISNSSYAQTIEIKKKPGSLRFYQDGEIMNIKTTLNLLKANEEAYNIARSAYSLRSIATGLRITGIIVITISLGSTVGSKEEAWEAFALGSGLVLVSIPFSVFSNKQIIKAVNVYNEGIATGNHTPRPLHFSVIGQGNEIGIRINF